MKKKNLSARFLLTIAAVCMLLGNLLGVMVSGETEGVCVPAIMYHTVIKIESRMGKYVVSPDILECDLKYLSEHGYTAVFVSELIDYVYKGKPLPEKPVLLTFDDGYYNYVEYVLPLLKKYDMKAVVSVVGEYADKAEREGDHNPNYSNLTWEEIGELCSSGYFEIASHTYSLHGSDKRMGCMKRSGENSASYRQLLEADLTKLQNTISEKSKITPPSVFTYPFGAICPESEDVLKELGFLASISCYERVTEFTRNPECLYQIGRYNRPYGISTERYMRKIGIG